MAEAIRMPLLSDTMKEGKIVAWHKKVGDTVKSDDVIADVETDKATMEVMPYVDGTLLYIGVQEGNAAQVNDIIAIVGKKDEDFQSLLDEKPAKTETPDQPAGSGNTANEEKTNTPAKQEQAPAPAPKKGDATVVRMPLLSDTMKEGKIVAWHKKVGDKVKSDDVIADVETDKATMEVMPYADGTLLYIGVKEGEAAKINDIIAIVGKEGTDVAPYLNEDTATPENKQEAPAAKEEEKQPEPQQQSSAPAEKQAQEAPADTKDGDRLKASPLARRMAKEKGIDLQELQGSGDNGRIIRRDIEGFEPAPKKEAAAPQQAATGRPAAAPAAVPAGEYEDIPNSQMRNVIARRLSESKFGAPHFYLRMSVNMDGAIAARKRMNELSPVKISFNDLIIKAAAMALRQHPEVNSSWMGDFIRRNHQIHIGTAVAVDEGLIVPVVRNADQKTMSQIAADASQLIEKARNKKLQPNEFSGNTFTISNLGMMDIDEFTAIINPPDACILAVGKIQPTPVVENNEVVIRNILKLTLSCDHRVVDGAIGASFLQTLKKYLEEPLTMLV